MTRLLLALVLAAGSAVPAASATERTVPVDPLGCHVTVSTTDLSVLLSNPPQIRTAGWTGATTTCP